MRRTLNNRLKRRRARRQAIFIAGGCVLMTLLVLTVFVFTPSSPPHEDEGVGEDSVQGEVEVQEAVVAPEGEEEDSPPLSLGLGGDVCFGLDVADVIEREGPEHPWPDISPVLKDYDITVVNLEGPLCRQGEPHPDQPSFHVRGDESCVPPMAEAGVDAVSLANDHIMDYGSQGLEETLNVLRGEDVESFGAGQSERIAEQPLVLEGENGARVALLAFCDVAPSSYTAGEETPGLSEAALERIREKVMKAAEEIHYVVVVYHWGTVGSRDITPRQRELAHACIEAGADLVAGCHPHVIQGLEIWEGVPIIYSLGNLVFCAQSEEGKNGLFAGCYFEDGRLSALEIVPLQVDDARPLHASGEKAGSILQEVASCSPGAGIEISPDGDKAWIKW